MALLASRARGSGAKRTIDTRSTAAASFGRCVVSGKVRGSEWKREREVSEKETQMRLSLSVSRVLTAELTRSPR